MLNKGNTGFAIIIDTREKLPYSFGGMAPVKVATLKAGDYSIMGLEGQIAIERKSKTDLYGTIGKGRNRFITELDKLADYDFAAIVLESSLSGLMRPPRFSTMMSPSAVVNSMIAWCLRYRVYVFFGDNRCMAEALTFRILEKYWKGKK